MIPLHNTVRRVEPDDESLARYKRNWQINGFGVEGQARLFAARVLVVGAGGLGSAVLPYLTAAGVGTIGICDGDVLEEHNLQRQVLYGEQSVGHSKAMEAKKRLRELNSHVTFALAEEVDQSLLDTRGATWDLIIDCTDSFRSKYLIADWCAQTGMPLVWGSVVAMTFQVSVFWSTPPPPLLPASLRDLYPSIPQPGTTPVAKDAGVLGSVVGQAGTIMATEAIKLITGFGEPLLGKVLMGDAKTQSMTVVPFRLGESHDPYQH